MKLKHFFALGALSAGVLAAMAIETIPLTFKEGQVISAGTMNAVFARVNMITRQPNQADLTGSWDCTETVPATGLAVNYTRDGTGLLATRKNTLVFGQPSSTGAMTFSSTVSPFQNTGVYTVAAMSAGVRLLILNGPANSQPLTVSYLDSDRFEAVANPIIGINHAAEGPGFLNCVKTNSPPAPADALTATVATGQVDLMWVDQSGTETGFRIEQKTAADGLWTTAQTVAANTTTTSIKLVPGTYWFRVIAFNNVGDAMASGEEQVVLP